MNIFTVTGSDYQTNCYLLEKDNSVILIDFVPEAESFILERGYNVEKVFLTHVHFDHIAGLADFQKKYNINVFMSYKAKENINNQFYNLTAFIPDDMKRNVKELDLNKVIALKHNEKVNILSDSVEITLFDTPGHTLDSAVFILHKERIVFTGDTIFKLSIGRTDLPGGDYKKLIESISFLFKEINDDYTIYPGHGESTKVVIEKNSNPFLVNTIT